MSVAANRLRLAALLGLLSIVLGSMGAHGKVHDALVAAGTLKNWDTAVSYHLPHAILLVCLAFALNGGGLAAAWAWNLLFAGVLLFSGSLYLHSWTQISWLVYVTPVGGMGMVLGWALLLFSRWQKQA